jgi:UDP-glucose 4-epimerase
MHKAIVTGGMGFIGKHVVNELLRKGFRVLVLDNFETTESRRHEGVNFHYTSPNQLPTTAFAQNTAEVLQVDLKLISENDIKKIISGYEYIFHLAALPRVEPSIQDPVPFHLSNALVSLKLMKAAKDLGVKKFIFSSSSSVYGNPKTTPTTEDADLDPMSPYALQKLICEQYLDLFHKLHDFNSVSLRYFNVYGAGQPVKGSYIPVMGIFFRQRLNGQHLTITGEGSQTRDFINVEDVAKANVAAALSDLPEGHNVYNIASGKNYSIKEIAGAISPKIRKTPPRFEPHTTLGDISKAKEAFRWSETDPFTSEKKEYKWEPTIDLMDWIEENRPKN